MSPAISPILIIIQSVAIVMAAIGVIVTIVWNRIIARRRATLDMLLAEQTNKGLLEIRSEYLGAVKAGTLTQYASPDRWLTPESFFLVSTLNRYEITAVGIDTGIIDARLYRQYWRTTVVRDWIRCKESVLKLRKEAKNEALFSDFQSLARRWATAEERLDC